MIDRAKCMINAENCYNGFKNRYSEKELELTKTSFKLNFNLVALNTTSRYFGNLVPTIYWVVNLRRYKLKGLFIIM